MKRFWRYILVVFGLLFLVGFLGAYSLWIEPNRLVVNKYQVTPNNWTTSFGSLKVVAISDIHGGAKYIDSKKIELLVTLVNQQEPDLILILGDFVSQKRTQEPVEKRPLKMPIAVIAEKLSGLKADLGVIAVIGNHDDWYDRKKVRGALEKAGITVLVDEIHSIERNGKTFKILGLRDYLSVDRWKEYNRRLLSIVESKVERGTPLIVAAHSPDSGAFISGNPLGIANHVSVFVAGHTHGGQVWLPIIGRPVVPSNFDQKYAAGVLENDRFPYFVTTGVGTSIMPVRFMVPPEVAVVEIKPR